jgi:hypothetical protein
MLAGADFPRGIPSKLKRRRYPLNRPTRHSDGRMRRRSKKVLSCMFEPYAKYQAVPEARPVNSSPRER